MESAFIESTSDWSSAVFGGSTLPDVRLADRLEAYGATQAVEPTASTAAVFRGDSAGREGAYRLIENARVEARDIEEGPFQHTAELVSGRSRVLAIQDTSSVAVKHRPLADSLKQQGSPTGFLVHSNLMVDGLTGEPLGLIAQERWTREQGAAKSKAKKNRVSYEERESFKWEKSSRQMSGRVYETNNIINVADRESDIFELLSYYDNEGMRYVIRARVDRRLDGEVAHLWPALEAAPVLGTRTVSVSQRGAQVGDITQKARAARQGRIASTEIRSVSVVLRPPSGWDGDEAIASNGLKINAVLVSEPDPPEGVEALQWLLLTTEDVETYQAAERVVRDYELRWLIEEFHKCWKTGCNLEERALQTLDAVERMMVILAPIAVRIMQLQALANRAIQDDEPEIECERVLSRDQWQCLWMADPRSNIEPLPQTVPSVRWAYGAIARFGGWTNSKRTGRVGWQTLWKGWSRLQERVAGWQAALATRPSTTA